MENQIYYANKYNSHIYYREIGIDYGENGKNKMCDAMQHNVRNLTEHTFLCKEFKKDSTKSYMGSMFIRKL